MPTPTIPDGELFMNATTYTGNGTTQNIVNAGGFQPDFVWIKQRSGSANHNLYDVLRIVSSDYKRLYSNLTVAEESSTYLGTTNLSSFNSNGFSVGSGTDTNNNSSTYVAWQWKAGGAAVTNTAGTISSQVSANTTSGFSIVTYTGTGASATVGHGLGVAPSMIIVKDRSGTNPWVVYHASLGVQYYTLLNATDASYNNLANYWSATAPSSTVFGLNTYGGNNQSSSNFVAYCWAPIAGYSAFGSYTGNGSADGPFVYLGFRPRFVLIKASSRIDDWKLIDTSRDTYNLSTQKLYPNLSAAENGSSGETSATNTMDILSNGFKLRTSNSGTNENAATYIYMAFAENPFKNSLAR